MAESRETAAERGADTGAGAYRVVGSRVLPVRPEQAWRAWSDPEVVRQWWGPTGFSCPRADFDFRVGGTSLVTMQAPEEYGGMQLHNGWTYTGIEEPSRIEFYLTFTDEQGRVLDPAAVGIPAGVPREVPHVVELTPLEGGHTQLTVTEHGYTSREARDVSQAGLGQTLDKLQALFGDRPWRTFWRTADAPRQHATMMAPQVRPGRPAPDFALPAFAPTTGAPQGTVRLSALRGRPVLLVYLRWLGWLPCLDHLAQLRQRQADLDAIGARVLTVSFETPERLRAYVRYHQLPFPALADPQRAVYRRYGMGRGPWWRIYGPRVLLGYLRAYLRGRRVTIRGDTLQQGGDFVIDAGGTVRLAHVGQDSFDRPPVDDLLRALAGARGGAGVTFDEKGDESLDATPPGRGA